MGKILTALFLCLAFLIGIVQNASAAASTFDQKNASGSFSENPDICTYKLGSLGQEPCWSDEIIDYDPASGVLSYVRQNPWSKFDPTGLFGTGMGLKNSEIRNPEFMKGYNKAFGPSLVGVVAVTVVGAVGPAVIAKEVLSEAGSAGFEAITGLPAPPTSLSDVKDIGKLVKNLPETVAKLKNKLSPSGPSQKDLIGCFPAGTLVWAESGLINIEKIKRGDKVWAYNFLTETWNLQPVINTFTNLEDKRLVTVEYRIDGKVETITPTFGHPFWIAENADEGSRESVFPCPNGKWIYAKNLLPGDSFLSKSQNIVEVVSIHVTGEIADVFNFHVKDDNNYTVGQHGILVHNSSMEPIPGGPVKPGDEMSFEELKSQKKNFGETEPMDMDHRPSNAAQLKAAEIEKGGPLTKAERARVTAEAPAVATPRKAHQQKSNTYGGRNTPAKIDADAADLEAARLKDDAAFGN